MQELVAAEGPAAAAGDSADDVLVQSLLTEARGGGGRKQLYVSLPTSLYSIYTRAMSKFNYW